MTLKSKKAHSWRSVTKNILAYSLVVGMTTLAAKADDIALGEPALAGSGCPAGTVSATVSPDQKALSILFDEYIVEAGDSVGKSTDRKSCNIAIGVHVPNGIQVSLLDVDFRGFNSLPRGASNRLSVEYFFAGVAGPKYIKTFQGQVEDDYHLTSNLAVASRTWAPCGKTVNLRINSSMFLRTSRGQDALGTLDSIDLSSGMIFHIKTRRCGEQDPVRTPRNPSDPGLPQDPDFPRGPVDPRNPRGNPRRGQGQDNRLKINQEQVICHSNGQRKTLCATKRSAGRKISAISIIQQHSHQACIVGKTYGITQNRKQVWTKKGCKGSFKVTYQGAIKLKRTLRIRR